MEKIEKLLKPCKYCGDQPKVYHQDYNGDTYVGDEYSIDCECGVCTTRLSKEELIQLWDK